MYFCFVSVTSYKISPSNEIIEGNNNNRKKDSDPVRKTRAKVNILTKLTEKTEPLNQGSKRVTRSRKSKPNNYLNVGHTSTLSKPPETPKNYKEKKVEDWIIKTRFSVGEIDQLTETMLENSNKSEVVVPSVSEDQLKSVSQIEVGIEETCTAKDEQAKQNGSTKPPCKKTDPLSEQFDQLLLKENKSQFITTTYGNKSNRQSRARCFVIDPDIFNTTGDSKNHSEIMKPSDKSQSTLEDFSSGSGEEWCLSKKRKFSTTKKSKIVSKKESKNTILSWKNKNVFNAKAKNTSTPSSIETNKKDSKKTSNLKDTDILNSSLSKNSFISTEKNKALEKSKCQLKAGIVESVKEIINDWDSSNEINCKNNDSKQVIGEHDQAFVTPLRDRRVQKSNPPTPGWSKLSSTKKEFNVSEKKKLSLKTLNKTNTSGKTSVLSVYETSNQHLNETDNAATLNKQEKICIKTPPSSKIGFDVNQYLSSAVITPVKDEIPNVNKKRDRDSGICNDRY